MVTIRYQNSKPIGDMYFPDDGSFWAEMLLDVNMERPQYPVQEEEHEDHIGDSHKVFQRWGKQYVIPFKAIESTCDAVSMLRLMDYVYINGNRVYDVDVEITWEEELDCLADVIVSFYTKRAVKTA